MSVNIKIENAQKRYGDNIIIENLSGSSPNLLNTSVFNKRAALPDNL